MLVYALKSSPRLLYVLDFIGKEIFNEPIQLTTDRDAFYNHNGPKINYSKIKISDAEFRIHNNQLLFESGIRVRDMKCFEFTGIKAFFETDDSDFSFDIFAAIFYLLSRYEEYLPHTKDKFGRYAHTSSLAFNESFLHLPLINIWLIEFKKAIWNKYPALQFRNNIFTYQPTYDIDIAWSYRNKGLLRNAGGLVKSALGGDWHAIKERMYVLLKKKKDPFDSYDWLDAIHKLNGLKPIYFFLLAFKQKDADKNISPLKDELQQLIKAHEHRYTTGIHPSWQSGDDEVLLEKEIKFLTELVGHPIIRSRQHYLRFTLPTTYRKLLRHGIKNDYSMGYGTINGFRASVALSFYWYDLENEAPTDLLVHPFCFMDANAYYELEQTPAMALEQLLTFRNIIKEVNGLMITLWHNNFLGTDRNFVGWREAYQNFLNQI